VRIGGRANVSRQTARGCAIRTEWDGTANRTATCRPFSPHNRIESHSRRHYAPQAPRQQPPPPPEGTPRAAHAAPPTARPHRAGRAPRTLAAPHARVYLAHASQKAPISCIGHAAQRALALSSCTHRLPRGPSRGMRVTHVPDKRAALTATLQSPCDAPGRCSGAGRVHGAAQG